jgi:hypothetical protein
LEIVARDSDNSWNTLVPFMNNYEDVVWHEKTGYAYTLFLHDHATGNIYPLTSGTMIDNDNPQIPDYGEPFWFSHYSDLILTYSDYHSIMYYDTGVGSAGCIWSLQTDVGALETNIERHEPVISTNGNVIWFFLTRAFSTPRYTTMTARPERPSAHQQYRIRRYPRHKRRRRRGLA